MMYIPIQLLTPGEQLQPNIIPPPILLTVPGVSSAILVIFPLAYYHPMANPTPGKPLFIFKALSVDLQRAKGQYAHKQKEILIGQLVDIFWDYPLRMFNISSLNNVRPSGLTDYLTAISKIRLTEPADAQELKAFIITI
jgi:hypothetical protein